MSERDDYIGPSAWDQLLRVLAGLPPIEDEQDQIEIDPMF